MSPTLPASAVMVGAFTLMWAIPPALNTNAPPRTPAPAPPRCGVGPDAPESSESEDASASRARRLKLEKIVAKMHAVRMSKHGHAASFARGPHDNPRSHTDVRAGHQPASQRRDTQGRQSTASGGVVKPHDGYAPRMRIPRAERYEVVLRRQIREAVASMCPGYNEEELIQMARDDPRARVMIPRAIRMRNETRSVRTGMRGVLQDGCDNVRTILQMQSRNEKELARTRAPEDSTRSDMHARNRVSDSTRFRPHQEPS